MNERGELFASTSILCIALMIFLTGNLPGCEQPAGGSGNPGDNSGNDGSNGSSEPIVIAKSTVRIGEFVVINHPSIKAGEPRTVSFDQLDGVVQEVEVVPHADGELSVPAIPNYRERSNLIVGGLFDVSIDGVEGAVEISVDNLYSLSNLEVGTIFRLFVESARNDTETMIEDLVNNYEGIADPSVEQQVRADLVESQNYLQGLLNQWDDEGKMTFQISDTESVDVDSTNIRYLERYLVAMIVGVHTEIQRRDPDATSRIVGGNCIGQIEELSGDDLRECMEQCIADVKAAAIRGSQVAGVLPAAVGAAITIFGVFVKAPLIILTGAIVAAAGIIHGFLTAYAANQNTDTYGQNDGEGFSSAREALSQAGRYAAGLVSPVASLALSAKDYSSSLEAAKCDGPDPRQRVIIGDDLIEFCEVVFVDGSTGDNPDDTSDEPECEIKADCAEDEICVDEKCVADPDSVESCETVGCPDGQACIDGECGPCEIDTDCPDGQLCIIDECVEGTDVGEGCENTGCDSGEVCCNSECIPFGVPTSGICPSTFEMDFGVFSPSIHDVSMVNFVLDTDAYAANCEYSRTDGTPGTYVLILYYEPVGLNPPSAGLCGAEDDDGDNIVRDNGYHSTVRTLSTGSVISGSVRVIDPDAVFGELINNASTANIGSECCPQ